ncbi:hypothetical protein Q8A73_001769 [Channa argus]|nr:hypothetical protein Q8A73_001769 [Channa argus]
MDPADASHLQRAVSSQGALLGQHDHQMWRIEEVLDRNTQQLSQVTDTLRVLCSMSASSTEPAPPPQLPTTPTVRKSYVPPPEPFSGDLDKCRVLLLQCRLVFAQQPQTYASDAAKVAYVVGLLRGRALEWAEARLGNSFLILFHTFVEELRKILDHPMRRRTQPTGFSLSARAFVVWRISRWSSGCSLWRPNGTTLLCGRFFATDCPTVLFLGFLIGEGEVKPDPEKTRAEQFTSPPILSQPDTSRQFVVEVDASEVGVGAVLSQRSEGDQKLRPCAFFLRYDSIPAKPDGPFSLTTSIFPSPTAPGLRTSNPTLCPTSTPLRHDPKPILHPSCVLGALTWEIEQTVRMAQQQEPDPGTGPPGLLFVPSRVHSQVLQWAHCSKFSCHPGADRSIHLLRRHFWWPSLVKDTWEFVAARATCARGKTPKKPPDGLLQPLPIPSRPWSHIALDFVTGLPPSHGNTTILTIIDRFSNAVHFVPLPKLPTATETAELLTQHVLRLHGIPHDIVSDRGPQFVSQVWKAFCNALGQPSVCPPGSTPNSMAKLSVQTRVWKPPSDASLHLTPPPGVHSFHGLNMLITLSLPLPQVSRPLCAL